MRVLTPLSRKRISGPSNINNATLDAAVTRIDKESIFGPSKLLRLWLGLGCDKMLDKNVTHLRLHHVTHRL